MLNKKAWEVIEVMMDYSYMSGNSGGGMMLFAWISYLLATALLVLGIVALWKYINQK